MKIIYLTSGPRGAGKSRYVDTLKKSQPEITVISRDKIFLEKFGRSSFDRDTGEFEIAWQIFREKTKLIISTASKDSKIVLDCWNGRSRERQNVIKMLREWGADMVVCLYFITSYDTCLHWFMKKSDKERAGLGKDSVDRDYKLYHHYAHDIDEDGFDIIRRINPCQLSFPGFPLI